MKKTNITITMLCLGACFAAADTKITWLADVTADRAETVTGVQSNQIRDAAAHIVRTDNPHGVTAAQIGALTHELDLVALRTYHYGSPDIVESPAEWFVFDGAGTITAFNWEAGRENVVIPWEIGGVPVTAIGANAFQTSGIVSVIAPQTVTVIGDYAFADRYSLTSVSLPQATAIGDYAFSYCNLLTSVSLPQATAIGDYAFYYCVSLASVSLPQATAIGDRAFAGCYSLTSIHMGQNAPPEATDVFAYITSPPNVYVTNPQATGWGDTWNGVPVVRPPLYGSNVTAQAYTLNGDTITEWPAGGGETSIIAPLYESGTNVTVTSTQSVYSVAVTGAGPVGIDWSGLALDGTGRAEVTLRLNVTEWAGTNVTFSPSLTFDRTPEILVTGVWEFACSTIDGTTTRVRQTWPECCAWEHMTGFAGTATYGAAGQPTFVATTDVVYVSIPNDGRIVRTVWTTYGTRYVPERGMLVDIGIPNPAASMPEIVQAGFTNRLLQGSLTQTFLGVAPSVGSGSVVFLRIQPDGDTATWTVNGWLQAVQTRPMNSNERAAYEAGWGP